MMATYGVIEGPSGEIGRVDIVNGVAVPDEGALEFLHDYDLTDLEGNPLELDDGPRYLAWLAIKIANPYYWVRLEE